MKKTKIWMLATMPTWQREPSVRQNGATQDTTSSR